MSEFLSNWLGPTVFLALIGIGFTVMGLNPPEFFIGKICFTLAAVVALVNIGWKFGFGQTEKVWQPALTIFIIFGIIGSLWFFSIKWVNGREYGLVKSGQTPSSIIPSTVFINPYEIIDKIKSTEQSLKNAVRDNYKGNWVKCKGKILDIIKSDSKVMEILFEVTSRRRSLESKPGLMFKIEKSKYLWIQAVGEKEMLLTGRIAGFGPTDIILLNNANLVLENEKIK